MTDTAFIIDHDGTQAKTERIFHASQTQLFKAHTDPAQIIQWWGESKFTTLVETLNVVIGGAWRYIQTDQEGHQQAFHGIYQVVDVPSKLVRTLIYEPIPGHMQIETAEFESQADGTTMVRTSLAFANKSDFDQIDTASLERAMRDSMHRLSALIEPGAPAISL